MRLHWPHRIDASGRTAETDQDRYVRQLIEHLLQTDPGERVMRPNLGAGVRALLFAPVNDDLLGGTQALVQNNLERWLGHLVEIGAVDVTNAQSRVTVTVVYRVRRTGGEGRVVVQQEV